MNQLDINISILPRCERIFGLTLPIDKVMYVCSYVEVFKIQVDKSTSVEILDDNPYKFADSLTHFLGSDGHTPIQQQNGNSISYHFSPNKDFVQVDFNIFDRIGQIKFQILSGDCFVASFSECGNYLILAEPYDFNVYRI